MRVSPWRVTMLGGAFCACVAACSDGVGDANQDDAGASGGSIASGGSGQADDASSDGGAASDESGSGGAATGGAPALLPFKGVANSPCAARQALGVSWYYNWTQSESEPCPDDSGGAFVPMIWGHPGNEQSFDGIDSAIETLVGQGHEWVLAFNEPDNSSQSNISVAKALELWPALAREGLSVASPATAANANPGQAWFSDFMTQLNANAELRADVLAIHWYGWNAGSCDATASQLENYLNWVEGFAGGRPIWLTEWGCLNQSAPDPETVVAFYQGALEVFARHPRVARYAWYPWATNCGLTEEGGTLTALGQAYADAPAYHQ